MAILNAGRIFYMQVLLEFAQCFSTCTNQGNIGAVRSYFTIFTF